MNPRHVDAEGFDAYHIAGDPKRHVSVRVRCATHTEASGFPIKRLTSCDRTERGGRCDDGDDFLEYHSGMALVYLRLGTGVRIDLELEIIKSLFTPGLSQGHDFALC